MGLLKKDEILVVFTAGVAKVLKVMGQHLNIKIQVRAISVHHQM